MPGSRAHYRIFVASPKDVGEERSIARAVIEALSRELGDAAQCTIEACGWEDVRPGMGRPQELINPLVRECDVLLGILWKRFGTDTGVAESGTREEFDIMRERFAAGEAVEVMMYFRDVPPEMLEDPGPQLSALLGFRQEMDRLGLYHSFAKPAEFSERLRADLTQWLLTRTGLTIPGGHSGRAGSTLDPVRQRLLERFVKSQVAENSHLPIAGFETRVRMPVELERVMIPLRARPAPNEAKLKRGRKEALGDQVEEEIIDFEQAWRRARKRNIATLVVLGAPGSGKTTLLKHLLLRCARDAAAMGLRAGTIPLLLPLRLVDPAQDLEAEIRRILRTDELQLPADLFEAELFGGTALLLLDGLDEVATGAARETTARWIETQRRRFPDCAMVLTARFAGYTAPHGSISRTFWSSRSNAFASRRSVTFSSAGL